MQFSFRAMTEPDARAIAAWHYDGVYAFYDMSQDEDDLAELLDPRSWGERYLAVVDEQSTLVGFYCFAVSERVVEIGLGLRPDLTGQGIGPAFFQAGLDYARERYKPAAFRLAVAAFNQRAIRVYEKAGFRLVRRFQQETNGGSHEFLEMARAELAL